MCFGSQARGKIGELAHMLNKNFIRPEESPCIKRPPATAPGKGLPGLCIAVKCKMKYGVYSGKAGYFNKRPPQMTRTLPEYPVRSLRGQELMPCQKSLPLTCTNVLHSVNDYPFSRFQCTADTHGGRPTGRN